MEYHPSLPPQNPDELMTYLNEEFVRIAQSFNNLQTGLWDIRYHLPAKIRPGLVVYLDGTSANPLGTGLEGLYRYGRDNAWHYIG